MNAFVYIPSHACAPPPLLAVSLAAERCLSLPCLASSHKLLAHSTRSISLHTGISYALLQAYL